ncbi:MAG TPA: hypothetical protein VLW52_06280 [Opitutaceae bacterium]|nr:hypothetical protein [Opitutaceae bacterium]
MIKAATALQPLLALTGAVALVAAARAQTADEVIAKARAYLGDEATLNAIHSVHFFGTIETGQATPGDTKAARSAIEIVFQEPYRQRITRTSPTTVQVTGLDDYDGWQQVQDLKDVNNWQLTLLQPEVVKNLRANTWENLNFFKGIEQRGGSVQIMGPATVKGIATIKVAFIHDPKIIFYRYFDAKSGKLVLTETNLGDQIMEEGEIMVNGLRFPQKVTSVGKAKNADGKVVEVPVVITFDKIILNETFPADYFSVPPMRPPSPPSPPPSAPAATGPMPSPPVTH